MANVNIPDLTNLTAPAVADELEIYDADAAENKALALSYMVRDTGGTGAIVTGGYTLTLPASGTAALLGTANTFTASQTIDAGTSETRLTLSDQSASGEYSTLRMLTGTAKYAWQVAAQNNVDNGLEITPSTAAGGTTFSTPAFVVHYDSKVSVGTNTASGVIHADQSSTTAAIPVLYLDQADVDQPIMQIETTIGTGNAVEAVGAKTLTTTHFIMVELPGGLTRYIPAGTIA